MSLYVNIHCTRAADLIESDSSLNHLIRRTNPVLTASLNGNTRKTKCKRYTNNPSWDQTLSLPLKPYDQSPVLYLCVWDKHRGYRNYLGELRIDVRDVFVEESDDPYITSPKWFKLHSNDTHSAFVTGSLLLSFELVVRRKGRIRRPQTIEEHDNAPVIKIQPPSRKNTQQAKQDFINGFRENNDSGAELNIQASQDTKKDLFNDWKNSLIYTRDHALNINEQGLYSDSGDASDVSISDIEGASVISGRSAEDTDNPKAILQRKLLKGVEENELEDTGLELEMESLLSTDYYSDASEKAAVETGTDNSDERRPLPAPSKRKRLFKKHLIESKFEIRNRKVDGVLFLEVVSCTDLPPVRRKTGMGRFDMDPFVVVTFGKQTFRTSYKRHSLNPIFNERLAFEILKSEKNFEVHFLVLDKDRFSLHDNVASVSIPLQDLIKSATANPKSMYIRPGDDVSGESLESTQDEFTDLELPQNDKITFVENKNVIETIEKRLIRKKLKLKYSDTSKFKTMDLSLNLDNDKYKDKYTSKLKIRVRYETYDNLRRSFWERLLDQYSLHDVGEEKPVSEVSEKEYDYIELISLLDALGCTNSDDIVTTFFAKFGKLPWGGDTLKIHQICDCLEDHIEGEDSENKLFEIERCPNCLKKKFVNKDDMDIVTHFAICGSKDWSIVNKLLVSSYVTPQLASKRWFTKVLIKLSYGKYQLGSNSANILVQDRRTGIVLEEKMGVYVRLGIRLLYKGSDSAKKKRIRTLLRKLSVKQGIKFDDPNLRFDIPSFVKFHKLDLSDCLETDLTKYKTFNDFFYRKLKPGARNIEGKDDEGIMVSPADCRCVAYNSVSSATELWIKGRNFTIAKLFNGNFHDLETSDVYKPEKCAVAVFRLAPQDYHRFHSPVTGKIEKIKFIEGEYYTVNPMAIRSELDVFGENVRALIAIETKEFGTVVMIPVGAMMVGSIILTKKEGDTITKGDEMGYFKFGGSTVILLVERDKFKFDSDLVSNSNQCIETLVRVGQSVGHSPNKPEFGRDHIHFSKLGEGSRKNLIRVITGGDLSDNKEIHSWEAMKMNLTKDWQ